MKVQVHRREPALAGTEQRIGLFPGKLQPAAPGITGQLRAVQAKLICFHPVEPAPQPHHLPPGHKPVAASHDEVGVVRQAACQRAQKIRRPVILQQMEIVQKQIAGPPALQRGTQIVQQHGGAAGVLRAVTAVQHGQARRRKGVLQAFPEDLQVL